MKILQVTIVVAGRGFGPPDSPGQLHPVNDVMWLAQIFLSWLWWYRSVDAYMLSRVGPFGTLTVIYYILVRDVIRTAPRRAFWCVAFRCERGLSLA